MQKNTLSTKNAPAAIGPYAQGTSFANLVFASGQIPLDPSTGNMVATDPAGQAKQCMENLKAVLEAGGSSLEKLLKVTIFLQDFSHFGLVNEVYASYFTGVYPARSCVQVARLPKDALVEIEAIGHI